VLSVLRLLCLQSLTNGGITGTKFDLLRREIVQVMYLLMYLSLPTKNRSLSNPAHQRLSVTSRRFRDLADLRVRVPVHVGEPREAGHDSAAGGVLDGRWVAICDLPAEPPTHRRGGQRHGPHELLVRVERLCAPERATGAARRHGQGLGRHPRIDARATAQARARVHADRRPGAPQRQGRRSASTSSSRRNVSPFVLRCGCAPLVF